MRKEPSSRRDFDKSKSCKPPRTIRWNWRLNVLTRNAEWKMTSNWKCPRSLLKTKDLSRWTLKREEWESKSTSVKSRDYGKRNLVYIVLRENKNGKREDSSKKWRKCRDTSSSNKNKRCSRNIKRSSNNSILKPPVVMVMLDLDENKKYEFMQHIT